MEGFRELLGLMGIQGVVDVIQMKQVIAWAFTWAWSLE
jgi:hypothetical protein